MSDFFYCDKCDAPVRTGRKCSRCFPSENKNKENYRREKKTEKIDNQCRFQYKGLRCVLPNSDRGRSNYCRWHRECQHDFKTCVAILEDAIHDRNKYLKFYRNEIFEDYILPLSEKLKAEAQAQEKSNSEYCRNWMRQQPQMRPYLKIIEKFERK